MDTFLVKLELTYVAVQSVSGDGNIYAQGGSIGADLGTWTTTTTTTTTVAPVNVSAVDNSTNSTDSDDAGWTGESDPGCLGGGGAGGRVALHRAVDTFSGAILAHGGTGYECGGAGTVLRMNTTDNTKKLTVDNENVCTPQDSRVDWTQLSDTHRGQLSFHTWLFDDPNSHDHVFEEVHLSGQAQLALYRKNGETFTQTITVKKTSGDKSAMWHVGSYQDFTAQLPDDSPEQQFGMLVYEGGVMQSEQTYTVTGISIENEGSMQGVEHLVIGPMGRITLRPDSSSGNLPEIVFTSVTVKGGGTLVIESEGNGMKLVGTDFTVESGGTVEADNMYLVADTLTVEDSAYIKADKLAVHSDGGQGKGINGRGAGHGGQGGKATNTGTASSSNSTTTPAYGGGLYYGDVVTPTSAGSSGIFKDFTNDVEVKGGGILKFDITTIANIDGVISCNGEDGTSLAGGASAGSIILNAHTFNGKGKISANGGKGTSTTGGGAGGRTAISYTDSEFTGSWEAFGGSSSHSTGGAGTVYVNANGKTKLFIDNKEPYSIEGTIQTFDQSGIEDYDSGRAWIVFPGSGSLTVDQLYLKNGAHLALEPAENPADAEYIFTTEGFYGDGFVESPCKLGTIHVGPHQTFTVKAVDRYFPAHAIVYEDGLLKTPSKLKYFNSRSTVYGTVSGVTELTLTKSTLDLKSTSRTEGSKTGGKYSISTISIMAGGILKLSDDIQYHLDTDNFYVAPSGLVEAGNLLLETHTVTIEEGGVIDLSERGNMKSGPGYLPNYGAGHSGEGGGYYNSSYDIYERGAAYDDFKEPVLAGSGGDTAAGGGVIKIQASDTVDIQGEINADGGSATSIDADGNSGNYGGASGGSIWITASNNARIGGLLHTNGGSATSSGGGGGGFIAIYYSNGYVDDRYITSYGGSTLNGETGAAGVIYLEENGNTKALIKTDEASDCLSTMSVNPDLASIELHTIEVMGRAKVGFLKRETTPALNAHVATIKGNDQSLIRIDQNVDLFWGTRLGQVDELRINTNILVNENGKIDLPKTVIIDKGWSLDVCGTISSNTDEMTVREGGALRMSHPASDLQIHTLVIDYNGKLEGSSYCDTTTNKVTLQLTYFNKTSDFSLDTSKFSLSASKEGTVSPTGTTNAVDSECPSSGSFTLKRNQYCTLSTGTHTYSTITINAGAELRLDGSKTGSGTTTIKAANIYLNFGGLITGIGKGFKTGGSGAASSGQGATHGGRGVGNTKSLYGSITAPVTYGSNGPSATDSSGRGGGQIKLQVTNTINIDGTIDMSADSGTGGSGGSIYITAKKIEGDGYMLAEGSSGGGGGRIAADASNTYSYTGTLSAVGGEDSSGNKGSAGTIYLEYPGVEKVIISGNGTETTPIITD
ncbi:adhesin BmaC autotransporter-like [Mercenaria mercenaria]|uniref:adhesin BmaC autotransporter-like n=1 Tax=Mercenaria mercenaria TaxID=6596 RepID=UPI00234EC51F|nr:adhesin BmaC autotransporter-like [Mercenaria mercenaria]